ncbi:MAG: glycosyltransferase family 4 protein [Thermoplasmata archaeon]|nr:glycosyltransferase family 4 protein [Thermoplasmata archaeon]MCI4356854.1 glycosyltransferase family 4 protein [Thermoplasmata archaeon]
MRIGIVVPTFPTGVTSSELWLAHGLAGRGHEVTVFSSDRAAARDRAWATGAGPPTPPDFPFRVQRISSLPLAYAEASVPLRVSEILGSRPDVCLLQEDYPPLSQFVAHVAHSSGIPYLLTCERYDDLDRGIPWLAVRAFERTTLPRLWRFSAALTFHSRASMRFFAARGVPPGRTHFIPSCTNSQLFRPGEGPSPPAVEALWSQGARRIRVLTVARLHPAKGLDTLARAISLARRSLPSLEAMVHGRGPDEPRLRATIASLRVGDALSIDRSSFPLADLPALYRSADLYVQPSRREPFGMAALEAMACGLPVIASATGGLADLVEDGTNGLLVPPSDAEGLGAAIARLAGDDELRRRMGRASRQRAESLFELSTVARAYEDLILRAPSSTN